MLKYLLTAAIPFAVFTCGDADADTAAEVPAVVQSAFEAAYPGATEVDWEEDDDHYEVEFTLNGEEMEREFSATGVEMED